MFTLTFKTGNEAFQESPVSEIERIFANIADHVANSDTSGFVHDINGNKVGNWSLTQEEA